MVSKLDVDLSSTSRILSVVDSCICKRAKKKTSKVGLKEKEKLSGGEKKYQKKMLLLDEYQ